MLSSEEWEETGSDVQRSLLSTKERSDRYRNAKPFEEWTEARGEGYWGGGGGSERVS